MGEMSNTLPQRAPRELPPIMGRGGPPMAHLMGKPEPAKDVRGTLLRLWSYLRRQRFALIFTVLIVVVNTGLTVLGPYLLGVAIDEALTPGDLPRLAQFAALMLGVYAASALLTWAQTYIMAGAAQRTVRDLRTDLFDRLQELPLRYFDSRPHGDLMSRLTNDVEMINTVLSESVTQLISGLLSLVAIAAVMLWLNPMLALVVLLTTPLLMTLLTRLVASRTRAAFRQQQATLGALNGLIEETITGQRVVIAYGREATVTAQFDAANQSFRRAATRAQIFAGFMGPLTNFVNNLGLAILGGVGGWMVIQGMATVGTIASFINYSRQFGRPLNEIANLYNTIQGAVAGAERVFELIDEASEHDEALDSPQTALTQSRKDAKDKSQTEQFLRSSASSLLRVESPRSTEIAGEVVFEEVSFAYTPDAPVLKRVSLHARPGETVALVGPTGAGKTTIVNLLTRFYDVDAGRILLDGADIRTLDRYALRRQLGIVLQDTYLFTGSVLENIRYGRLDATDEEVYAAARLANAEQFIQRLPHGYATLLSERASNLSQGQRQLLAIARAILANPRILILDEATSSVDTRTEQQIQEAMLRLMTGRTSFVIAHRLSTIRNADQILVINHGEIVERGTHATLLAQRGFYYDLYTSQFRGQKVTLTQVIASGVT
ncbi:MAG: multidrug ABC transporter ATP-binding protein [Chloroflexota bacterium]|nr:MAG: multidrug ABC transporter ATP-binding protein [Chloroflexota bacterium]